MTSLITGGAGFIGSHLCELLLARGENVIIVDDLSTGSVENVRNVRQHPQLHCVFESIMNRSLLCELVDQADVVYHLAAAVGVRRIIESPVRTIETNVRGTELVLECSAKKSKRVFIASTSEVYGKNASVPFREEDDIVMGASSRSRWSYATSKLLDEFLALAYWNEKKLPVTIGRLFNTVGPRQTGRYGMVLPSFVNQALENKPITVFGSGNQSRCFSHVSDVAAAIIRLMHTDAAIGQVVNIGSDQEVSIACLADMVKALTGSSSLIRFIPYDEAYAPGFEDMERRVPGCEKLVSMIGFRPTTQLSSIIESVIEYCRTARKKTCQSVGQCSVATK
jgi:UDP-glucose 4-epimerase